MFPLTKWDAVREGDDSDIPSELSCHIDGWITNPMTTPLPENISLPRECCVDPIANIERFIGPPDIRPGGWGRKPDEVNYQLLNVQTGEVAEVHVNRKTKNYTITPDISTWEIVSRIS